MAVQSKTLIGDVGSAVLAETLSQLNRAAGYASSPLAATIPAGPGTGIPLVAGVAGGYVIARFTEDVYVTDVTMGFGAAAVNLDAATDRVGLVVGTNPDGSAGTLVGQVAGFGAGAGEFVVTTNLYATLTSLAAASSTAAIVAGGTDAPFRVDAGNSLALVFDVAAPVATAANHLQTVTVTYRPVKDSLTTSPSYTKTMQNFSSVAR